MGGEKRKNSRGRVRGHLDLWRRVWITKVERREMSHACRIMTPLGSSGLSKKQFHDEVQSFSLSLCFDDL